MGIWMLLWGWKDRLLFRREREGEDVSERVEIESGNVEERGKTCRDIGGWGGRG